MHEIDNLSYDAIVKYFNALSQFGYKSYGNVSKLMALLTLGDMLHIFNEYITEKDLRAIINAVYCLSGTTCLIDFPEFSGNEDSLVHQTKLCFTARVTEDNRFRVTEDDLLRAKA